MKSLKEMSIEQLVQNWRDAAAERNAAHRAKKTRLANRLLDVREDTWLEIVSRGDHAFDAFLVLLEDSDLDIRAQAGGALLRVRNAEAVAALTAIRSDNVFARRTLSLWSMGTHAVL